MNLESWLGFRFGPKIKIQDAAKTQNSRFGPRFKIALSKIVGRLATARHPKTDEKAVNTTNVWVK